jgi:hypothetical protein
MTTVNEIVTAVSRLSADDFLTLRQELDQLEQQHWETELEKATEELTCADVTEDYVDQLVLRRRRESRP